MNIFYSPKCLEYGYPEHAENSKRVLGIAELIKKKADKDWKFFEPKECKEEDLLLVHRKRLIESVKRGSFFDPDTPSYDGIFSYAKLAVGSAIESMKSAINGKNSFSLMRPPGHHAGKDFLGGFCYFNNIAVATAKALEEVNKVAILDIDGHHGNGTEDIFIENEWQNKVMFISLHEYPEYPGTGFSSNKNCINFPLDSGTNGVIYLDFFIKAIENIRKFNPDVIAVSAGFDTYKNDPLLELKLSLDDYTKMSEVLGKLNIPICVVLEGGYSSDLPLCVWNFLSNLQSD